MAKHFHSTKYAASSSPRCAAFICRQPRVPPARAMTSSQLRNWFALCLTRLLVVDAITGLGTTRLDVDAWGIDVIIGGSQKALMIPPGLGLRRDQRTWMAAHGDGEIPAILLRSAEGTEICSQRRKPRPRPRLLCLPGWGRRSIMCVNWAMGNLAAGRDALIANAELCAAMTRAGVAALGLKLFAPELSVGCADGRHAAGWHRFNGHLQTLPRTVWRGRGQRKCGLEGTAFSHCPHWATTIIWTRWIVLAALEHVIAEAAGKKVRVWKGGKVRRRRFMHRPPLRHKPRRSPLRKSRSFAPLRMTNTEKGEGSSESIAS
jgi:hypothetical protein